MIIGLLGLALAADPEVEPTPIPDGWPTPEEAWAERASDARAARISGIWMTGLGPPVGSLGVMVAVIGGFNGDGTLMTTGFTVAGAGGAATVAGPPTIAGGALWERRTLLFRGVPVRRTWADVSIGLYVGAAGLGLISAGACCGPGQALGGMTAIGLYYASALAAGGQVADNKRARRTAGLQVMLPEDAPPLRVSVVPQRDGLAICGVW